MNPPSNAHLSRNKLWNFARQLVGAHNEQLMVGSIMHRERAGIPPEAIKPVGVGGATGAREVVHVTRRRERGIDTRGLGAHRMSCQRPNVGGATSKGFDLARYLALEGMRRRQLRRILTDVELDERIFGRSLHAGKDRAVDRPHV